MSCSIVTHQRQEWLPKNLEETAVKYMHVGKLLLLFFGIHEKETRISIHIRERRRKRQSSRIEDHARARILLTSVPHNRTAHDHLVTYP